MSVQAGTWNLDSAPIDRLAFEGLGESLAEWGSDGIAYHYDKDLALLYRPFHSNNESRLETQPYCTESDCLITWDGRLDNREDLLPDVMGHTDIGKTDVSLVGALWDRYGTAAFSRIVGDFACAIWNPRVRALYLVRDFAGVRSLYYAIRANRVVWSSRLDPLCRRLSALIPGTVLTPCDRWIAGHMAWLPETEMTPVSEVAAVAPAHWIRITNDGTVTKQQYWSFASGKRISYKTDGEYEEHFRQLFFQAVKRRLRSDSPVVAELSGGIDSSCIVCVASRLVCQKPEVITISRYTDSNPLGDHLDQIERVEQWIGKKGIRFQTDRYQKSSYVNVDPFYTVLPHLSTSDAIDFERKWAASIKEVGGRVVLSGEGGDELTGAHQSPAPLLAQQLITGHWIRLVKDTFAWSAQRKVRIGIMFIEALRYTWNSGQFQQVNDAGKWLSSDFIRRTNYISLQSASYEKRYLMPEHRRLADLFEGVRRILAARYDTFEYTYPFVDRDICEFSFAIPFEQLLRPGQRRSLLRRSMQGVVPSFVIDQKGKKRGASQSPPLEHLIHHTLACSTCRDDTAPFLLSTFTTDLAQRLAEAAGSPKVNQVRVLQKICSLIRWENTLRSFAPPLLNKKGGESI